MVTHGGFNQHRNVSASRNRDNDLADLNIQHMLGLPVCTQTVQVLRLHFIGQFQLYHHIQRFSRFDRIIAIECADVQNAQAAHLQKILQQLGATPFNALGGDTVKVDNIICHQAVPA
ncbi:conserved hypothetical protein [Ricinus communis]|uniref:Uncharacterized protein n=1 Tax=Ricinus communis TaxID=3988 RepID=B9TEP7_RICCO|nr:conserved hypothetical protein [Ricinus communis]